MVEPLSLRPARLIYNPRSRRGSELDLELARTALADAGYSMTEVALDKDILLIDAVRADPQPELLVLAGGDGTFNRAAQLLFETQLPFAIIPMGTANDLARSLEIPMEPDAVLMALKNFVPRKIDLGRVNDKLFFNVAHIGLGVHVTHNLTPESKKTWGVFSYLKAFFSAVAQMKTFRVHLELDGEPHKLRSLHLAVGNGRYYGGGNLMTESSQMDDGVLKIYSLKPQSLWQLLTLAPLLRSGRAGNDTAARVFCAKAETISVRTRKAMEIDADGEPVCKTPATFSVMKQAVTVMAPPKAYPQSQ